MHFVLIYPDDSNSDKILTIGVNSAHCVMRVTQNHGQERCLFEVTEHVARDMYVAMNRAEGEGLGQQQEFALSPQDSCFDIKVSFICPVLGFGYANLMVTTFGRGFGRPLQHFSFALTKECFQNLNDFLFNYFDLYML